MLVMAMLLIVLSVSAPSLSRFFRGQNLDGEARRFLALTRLGQSRAVAEGLPMRLWIDAKAGRYGLATEASYGDQSDEKAVEFELNENLSIEVEAPVLGLAALGSKTAFAGTSGSARTLGNLPAIRFTPDGFLGEDSPVRVWLRESREGNEEGLDRGPEPDHRIQIGQSQNRLYYEIQTNLLQVLRR
jgi:type II secretory pathway pseudopilin PulG